jgi:peroxiredoxin
MGRMTADPVLAEAAALAQTPLLTPDGEPVTLAAFRGTPLVVQFVRYFGCLPCQAYLRALDERTDELAAAGVRPIAVGGSADYQARWLRDTGVRMPLLLDPDQRLRDAVGFGSLSGRQLMAPRGLRTYAAAVLSGIRPQRITGDVRRSPGIAILDTSIEVRWTYEGTALGDYPSLDEVTAAAMLVTAGERRDG